MRIFDGFAMNGEDIFEDIVFEDAVVFDDAVLGRNLPAFLFDWLHPGCYWMVLK